MTDKYLFLHQDSNKRLVMKKSKVFCLLVLNFNLRHFITKLSVHPLAITSCYAGKRLKVIDELEHD